jgi:peptidoglycan/xylan/chitin deacetylase (PgdA/CDA1 family)
MGFMKKVILSFDDGYEQDYTEAYKYLKSKGLKATSYLVTGDVGKNGYLSWDNVREMIKDGWDFQCHTHHHEMLTKLTEQEIDRDIRISKNEFFRRCFPIPEHCAHPFGVKNDISEKVIKKHFKTARAGSTAKGGDYDIISYGIHGNHDLKELVRDNSVLFLHTHDVSDNHKGYGVSPAKFKKTVDYLIRKDFDFITISEYFVNKELYQQIFNKNKKFVIMAAGSAKRWGDYLGVPKQLVEVDNEPILHRTIRLLKENNIQDIYVTVPEKGYYGDLGVEEIVGSSEKEIDKFLNAKHLSGAVFMWGDCWFSEEAIKTIIENQEPLMFFGNGGGNKYTSKRWGEIYAVKTNDTFFEKVVELDANRDQMQRCASWELYGYIFTGELPTRNYAPHQPTPNTDGLFISDPVKLSRYFTEIHDFTDDFDYPEDYDIWIERYNHHFLKEVWDAEPKKKFTVSYNIMAHPSRKEFVNYLKNKLGDVKVIWDKTNNIWDTRKMCLEDHIKQGKDFGITIQDDTLLCENFKEKAEQFINQIGEKEVIHNFFYRMYSSPLVVEEAINRRENYIKNETPGIVSELCFSFPTHLMREMIDACDSSDKCSVYVPEGAKDADWVMDEGYVKDKGLYSYFTIPSLADHRVEIDSLYYPKGFISPNVLKYRRSWWFYGEPWGGNQKKTIL